MSENKSELVEVCNLCNKNFMMTEETQCSKCLDNVCYNCQQEHSCNDGVWESIYDKKEPEFIKVLKKFSQELLIAMNKDYNFLLEENRNLKSENEKLKNK